MRLVYINTYIHTCTYIRIYIYVYIQPTCHLGNKAGSEAAIRAPLSMRRRGSGGWGAVRCLTGQVGHSPEHRPLLLPTGVAPLEVAALLEGGVVEEVEIGVPPRSSATRRRRRMRRPLIKRHSGVRCKVQWRRGAVAPSSNLVAWLLNFFIFSQILKRAAALGTLWYPKALADSCEDGFEDFCALIRDLSHSVTGI